MTPSISDLFLAYRQAKTALYFERRGVGLVELAGFESQLWPRLEALRSLLSENGGWFDGVPIGEVWLIPKALHSSPESQGVVRIGSKDPRGAVPALDVQLRLSPTPEFAIVEVLFLWKFGPALQSGLGPQSLGHRLDIRDGSLRRTSRWLFEYWPKRYQQFRTEPLLEAREALRRSGGAVGILSVDLAGFYDTIDPGFLLDQRFMGHLPERGEREQIDADEYRTAVKSLLSSYHSFRVLAERRTGIPWSTGIPIGALTSRLVANVSLATLDQAITTQEHVVCYRRYVDDLVIVERSTTSSVASIDDAVRRMLPHLVVEDGIFRFSDKATPLL